MTDERDLPSDNPNLELHRAAGRTEAVERGAPAGPGSPGDDFAEADLAALNAQIAREDRIVTTLESKSFSRLAWERFKRNKQAVGGSLVVLALVFVGAFAPLLANNLPYVVETTRPDLYETAINVIYDDAYFQLEELADAPDSARYLEGSRIGNLRDNYARMLEQLAPQRRGELEAWWKRFEASALSKPAKVDESLTLLDELEEKFHPSMVEPGSLPFATQVYYPAFRSLTWKEVAFMATFLLMTLSFPMRSFLFGGARGWLTFGAASWALTGLLWWQINPPVSDTANYKIMRDRGWAKRVSFPPVPYGENENITDQAKESPSWFISPKRSAKRFFRHIDRLANPPDGSPVDAAELENRLQKVYETWTTRAFREGSSVGDFLKATNTMGLASLVDTSWKNVPGGKLRDAKVKGRIQTDKGSFDAEARFVVEGGDWKLTALKTKDLELGEFGEVASSQDYHWLGTDGNGRDLLSRMIYSTRIAMSIGVVAVSIYCFIGIVLGALAGYFGGTFDLMLSRIIEIVICFPVLFLLLIVVSFAGSSELFRSVDKIYLIMIVIGLIQWTDIARLVRGEFLRLTNEEFVQAIRAVGGSNSRIMFKHVLPNALGPVLVSASFGIASAILYESSLSFIGLGVTPPTASWGTLLFQAREDLQGMWWMTLFPGAAIFLAVTCFNLLGEGARDALDPKAIEKH
jgi:ABC-type dipeptide/oligopeptide/nickel transport system permease subunit